jgi:hypothetical protein
VKPGKFFFGTAAIVTAIALTASGAPALAAPAHGTAPVAHHPLGDREPSPVGRMPDGRRLTASSGYELCLYHDSDLCNADLLNMNPATEIILGDINEIGVGVLVALIIIWIQNKTGNSYSAKVVGYFDGNPKEWPTNECLGAWGYGSSPHLGSCNSAHGIYWQLQQSGSGGGGVWNTYSRGYLTAKPTPNGDDKLWISGNCPDCWQTWADYTT